MKRSTVAFVVLMILGALVIFASIELNARETDNTDSTLQESAVVLELFTSQGCSSCPPADELLKRVQKNATSPVIALSYHVDYWNYIGWEDPFSHEDYTARQSSYNHKFNSRSNYTPQIVVNGREHLVGSNAPKLYSKISSYSRKPLDNVVTLSDIQVGSSGISFNYNIVGPTEGREIRALLIIEQRETNVARGENRNRKLSNSNIVVGQKVITVTDKEGMLELFIPELVRKSDDLRVVLLVQNEELDITGAVKSASVSI